MAFFVTGATGNVGSELIRILAEAGEPVRALVREGRAGGLPLGVEPVIGDLNRTETFASALRGIEGAFLLSGYEQQEQTLRALRESGARRVVLLSSGSLPGEDSNAVSRYHAASEAAVEASCLAWTHLRPPSFMTNALRWLPELRQGDLVREPFGDFASATIDPFDLASVAAEALRSPSYEGQALYPTGPQALQPAERVAILGSVLGRPLRFHAIPDEEARADLSKSMPPHYVEAFLRFYVDGTLNEATVRSTVEDITGRAARSFEQWCRANTAAFA